MIWAIVVAAGTGTRYGGAKQFAVLGGRPLVDWALEHPRALCDGVVLVVPPDRTGERRDGVTVVAGGATRSGSVRAGLAAVPAEADRVLVHDAARPLATRATFEAVIAALETADAVVPAVPVVDSLRQLEGGAVDRDGVVAVQTPQGFRAAALRAAHAGEAEASDDATLVEQAGGKVCLVPGDPRAVKITTRDDLRMAETLLAP